MQSKSPTAYADRTRDLVDKVCAALVLASPDREHPAARYGQMLRLLSKKLEQLSDQSVSSQLTLLMSGCPFPLSKPRTCPGLAA